MSGPFMMPARETLVFVMLDTQELRDFILRETSTATSYGLLLDLFYRILKEYGIPYTTIRAKRMRQVQFGLWDRKRKSI